MDVCQHTPPLSGMPWFNTEIYTPAQLFVFLVGCSLWVVIYAIYIRNGRRYGFIEMPIIAAASNIAWEGLWGLCFRTDMGLALVIGYALWFFMDIYIFSLVIRYGVDQVHMDQFKKNYKYWITGIMLVWAVVYYAFVREGYDTSTGMLSGVIAQVLISGLYPIMLLRRGTLQGISMSLPWIKMSATACITLFCFMYWPPGGAEGVPLGDQAWLIKLLWLFSLAMDVYYVWLVREKRRDPAWNPELSAA